ncbi:hypothetical protein MKX01_032130 [Papaver californicum]|nr:hypothetical protein MKX01_032130 [Papaver californicum]
MVLSNKKLKEKIRSILTETSIEKLNVKSPKATVKKTDTKNSEIQSLKVVLDTKTKRRGLSLKEKNKKDVPFEVIHEGTNDDTKKENKKESGLVGLNDGDKKRMRRKRKRRRLRMMQKLMRKKSQEIVEIATKVYVGGIPYYSTEDDIRSFFESCGTITELECMSFPDTAKFRGIAMISFKTDAAAKRALALDGAEMGGLFLKIQPYKTTISRPQKSLSADFAPKIVEGYNRVYVGNLAWDITEDDLKQLFKGCKISSVQFGTDKETGEFRGYAHVDFEDSLSLAMALELDQKEVCGRPARITCAVPKSEAKAGSKPLGPQILKAENGSSNQVTIGKKAESESITPIVEAKVENENAITLTTSVSGVKKRRTCYECGVAGHISSDCPMKKQAADTVNMEIVEEQTSYPMFISEEKLENETSNTELHEEWREEATNML